MINLAFDRMDQFYIVTAETGNKLFIIDTRGKVAACLIPTFRAGRGWMGMRNIFVGKGR